MEIKISGTCNYYSRWETVRHGVPQGSVLGPLLFNIYINDFPGSVNIESDVIMFADDTSVLISNSDYDELNRKFNSVLTCVSKWFQTNQLVLNAEKTNLVKFTLTRFSQCPINLIYPDQTHVETNTIKFLGLQLDSQLTWKTDINYLLNKLSTVCFITRRSSQILNIETMRIVYFTHFHSLIKYGIIFWGKSTTMHKVFLIQKKIIRIMLEIGSRCSCRNSFKT